MLEALFGNIPLMIMATGALVGSAASLVGVFLVLRKNSMLSDAISHSIVFGIVVVWLLTHQQSGPVQIIGAALTGLLTVYLTELLVKSRKVKDDAAIGLVFPALFSIGVLLLNLYARSVHIDTHTVLLGEIGFVWLNTISIAGHEVPQALVWMSVVTLVNAAFVTLLSYGLLALTSMTAVAAFDAVGAILFIAFVIVPPSAAYLLTDRLWQMLVIAVLIAIASSVLGYHAAVALDVSIGGMMAVMTGGFLAAAFLLGPRYGILAQSWRRMGQRYVNESRTLAVHLYNHEDQPESREETVIDALRDHLGWQDRKADQVVQRSLRLGLVVRDGIDLHLTAKGRRVALELLEPWRTA